MTEGYHVKEYGQPVKRYVQTMDLKDDPELIAEYKRRHSQEEAWPEIRAGIREVGIVELNIYCNKSAYLQEFARIPSQICIFCIFLLAIPSKMNNFAAIYWKGIVSNTIYLWQKN